MRGSAREGKPQPDERLPRAVCTPLMRLPQIATWLVMFPLAATPVIALVVACSACSGSPVNASATEDGRTLISVQRSLMKTRFRIDVVVSDEASGRAAVEAALAEVERSEETLSNWSESSEISEVNRFAGLQPVVVSDELMTVLDRALFFGAATDGAFDITFASCDGLWSVRERRVPTDVELAACLEHVDYRRVALDFQSSAVFVSDPKTRLGIAGLSKGYRVDRAARALERAGILDYVVDGGGDMRVSTGPGRPPWLIEVADPRRPERALGTLELSSGAVATSGDYQWFFELAGVRYHHILDPDTGRPADRAISATVIAPNALDADALATGLFVMGPVAGVGLAERLDGVEALLIAPDLSLHATTGFPALIDAAVSEPS